MRDIPDMATSMAHIFNSFHTEPSLLLRTLTKQSLEVPSIAQKQKQKKRKA